jgi:hypothetical protein
VGHTGGTRRDRGAAREADLDERYDLIADLRTIGDHWPLTMGSEFEWIKRFRENGWWTDGFDRMLVACPWASSWGT